LTSRENRRQFGPCSPRDLSGQEFPGLSRISFLRAPNDQMWDVFQFAGAGWELTSDNPRSRQAATGNRQLPPSRCRHRVIRSFLDAGRHTATHWWFARAERRQMTIQWQISLGSQILASASPAAADGPAVCRDRPGRLVSVVASEACPGWIRSAAHRSICRSPRGSPKALLGGTSR